MTSVLPAVPASKTHEEENFPVASRLLAPALRAPILAFYRFVRMADDIADAADLAPETKLARLDALAHALATDGQGVGAAADLLAVQARHGAGAREALVMLDAFRQDAVKTRYADWDELVAYCTRSADPVGRFLLRLHGESEAAIPASDALSTALQILNHLQDLVKDRDALDRIYLPVPWLERAGGIEAFFARENGVARRAVIDAALDRVEDDLARAASLPSDIADRRLSAEAAATLALGRRLARHLRRHDPVLGRVGLGKPDFLAAAATGARALAFRPVRDDAGVVRAIVNRSASSFAMGMAAARGERRRAIHATYAFCRAVDDIADGAAPEPEKRAFLARWRAEIDALETSPRTPIGRELAWASRAFGLPRAEFHAMLDGMESDAADVVRVADEAALEAYCRRVAGAVGVLAVRIFGAPDADAFAEKLGRALQLVNILRDIDADADMERVYVPRTRLAAAGIPEGPAPAIVADPRFPALCETLAGETRQAFTAADAALDGLDRRALKPALLMRDGYRRLFDRLCERGFTRRGTRIRLSTGDRAGLFLRALRPLP